MEFLQKSHNHLTLIMKFFTVQKKSAFRNDGLFYIIYEEESTNFLINSEDL